MGLIIGTCVARLEVLERFSRKKWLARLSERTTNLMDVIVVYRHGSCASLIVFTL